jgi:hypothetical protein
VQAADKEADGLSSIVSLRSREKQPSPQLLDDQFEIDSNPLHWTQEDVYQYLIKTDDCADVAQKCKDEVQYTVEESFQYSRAKVSDLFGIVPLCHAA